MKKSSSNPQLNSFLLFLKVLDIGTWLMMLRCSELTPCSESIPGLGILDLKTFHVFHLLAGLKFNIVFINVYFTF